MKKLIDKWQAIKLGYKLHQLEKRYKRARLNGNLEKAEEYRIRIKEIHEAFKHTKGNQ
jgi:hypothetical protein